MHLPDQKNNVVTKFNIKQEVHMKITTLEKVFNRVDALSQNCYDQFINVNDVSFDNLDSVKIAGESHLDLLKVRVRAIQGVEDF